MRKTTVCLTAALLILCAAALCVTSCSPTINEPCGEPVNLIAEGLMKQSPTIYLSAFEGKYINGLRDYYDTFSEDDLDSLIAETLEQTYEYDKEICGSMMSIKLELNYSTPLDAMPEGSYIGEFEPGGEVSEIYELGVSYTIEGISGSTETRDCTLYVYRVNGVFDLHPMSLFFVFQ